MATIKMDPSEMTAKAAQLNQKGDAFHTVVTEMETLVKQLCGAWDGAASDAYATQFNGLKPGFQKVEELIQDLAQQIRDISKIISDADQDIANKLNS